MSFGNTSDKRRSAAKKHLLNVRWATPIEQQRNRRDSISFTVYGEKLSVYEIRDRYGNRG